jgi:3-oxo-5-alpha-steroid 4-dehydrogenase 1
MTNEQQFFEALVYVWLAVAAVTFLALQFLSAPYGRHARKGWGATIHRTVGWVLMESPAVFVMLFFLLLSSRRTEPVFLVFTAIWMLHYVNRTFIFPFRMRGGQLRMPLMIAALGFFFNLMNGYMQGRYLFTFGPPRDISWFTDPRFIVGIILFVSGYLINQQSDSILRNLRQPGETGYLIPRGGGYRLVSCPNYFGELLEWTGWAILTWSISGVVFVLWTAANLIPRARSHHQWYRKTFPDYPPNRKAVIPFLF